MESPQDRLASAVKAARLARGGMTQAEAAGVAGVSDTTWNQIERGQPVSERSLAKVGSLLWGDASVPVRILAGEDPPDDEPISSRDELLEAVRDLTEAVRELRADMRDRR